MTLPAASTPLVSVLIPAFNAERTILETLHSVQTQSYRRLEIIVVDDGSEDCTTALVCQAAKADPRLKLIRQANQGVACARNTGLSAAGGNLVAPLDADDLWHADKIVRQVERLRRVGSSAGFVYCWSVDIDKNAQILGQRLDLDRYEGDVFAPLVVTNFLGNSSVPLIRRPLLDAVGGWDPGLRAQGAQGCEDWLLYLQLAHRAGLALEPAVLVGYRKHDGSMSRDTHQMRRSHRAVLAEASRLRPGLPPNLFRWSRGAFDMYRACQLAADGHQAARAWAMLQSIYRDPIWLARRSTRRAVNNWLRRALLQGRDEDAPVLRPFSAVQPEPLHEVGEGSLQERRRRVLARMLAPAPQGAERWLDAMPTGQAGRS